MALRAIIHEDVESFCSSLPISIDDSSCGRLYSKDHYSKASVSIDTQDMMGLSEFEEIPPEEFAKDLPQVWTRILAYLTCEDVTRYQQVAQKFYETLIPERLLLDQHNCVPHLSRPEYLLSKPKTLLTSISVNHVLCLGHDRILVSENRTKTCIYNHLPSATAPFSNDSWEELV